MRLVFEEPESGVTVVKLTHTEVPEEDRLVFDYIDYDRMFRFGDLCY